MKLTKLHLFLIIIAVLLASTLGFSIKEYFENEDSLVKFSLICILERLRAMNKLRHLII